MAMRKVRNVLLAANLAILPFLLDAGKVEDVVQESAGVLPFLQFTNGGVRVNFGGYHAEAGLGGLLGDSRAGGGLHASAGTPFGPHASAGLGGLLSGDNANTGGGLHAEAGLGNGRPEARAGLGGVLDGSGNSNVPASGVLYAAASPGNVEATNIKAANSHTNVQLISGSGSKAHKHERAIASKSVVLINEAAPSPVLTETKYSAVPATGVSAGLYGSLYAGGNIGNVGGKSAFESAQNVPASDNKPIDNDRKVVESSLIGGGAGATAQANAGANANAAVGGSVNTVQEQQPVLNRWYFRKRFRTGPWRKQVIHTSSFVPSVPVAASGSVSGSAAGVASGLTADATSGSDVVFVGSKTYKSGSLFDDIFNIPISTLTAVNQLLRNNAG